MSQQIVDKERSAPARLYPLIVGAAVALGIALRLRGAQGDLWLDEIWTLRLIAPLQSAADIFLRAPSDNNHYLNSLWLWLVGPEASTVTMRLASIIIGGLSIIAAAAACRRHSATAAAVAAILVATSYFFVHYGSEARGYAGMILCILTAKAALDRLLDDEASLGAWMLFALAICVGVFFHLTMVEAAGALALAALAQRFAESRPRRGFAIALVAGAACIPGLACFAAGMFSPRFHMGSLEPFTFDLFFQGLGGAIRATFGVPPFLGDRATVAVTAACALGAVALLPPQRRWFPVVAVFGLPLLHVVLQIPSQFYPRFHLTTAVGLILLASEALAALLIGGGAARIFAVAVLGLFIAGQSYGLANFFRDGRGGYVESVRLMTANGPARYSVDFAKVETKVIADYHAQRLGLPLRHIPFTGLCEEAPEWLIEVAMPDDPAEKPEKLKAHGVNCDRVFTRVKTLRAWGLSGYIWTLYRSDG